MLPRLWFGLFVLARVEGDSLRPTLTPGDIVFALRWYRRPRAGDVVLADLGDRVVVKRIAALDQQGCSLGVESPFGWVPQRALVARAVVALRRSGGTGRSLTVIRIAAEAGKWRGCSVS